MPVTTRRSDAEPVNAQIGRAHRPQLRHKPNALGQRLLWVMPTLELDAVADGRGFMRLTAVLTMASRPPPAVCALRLAAPTAQPVPNGDPVLLMSWTFAECTIKVSMFPSLPGTMHLASQETSSASSSARSERSYPGLLLRMVTNTYLDNRCLCLADSRWNRSCHFMQKRKMR